MIGAIIGDVVGSRFEFNNIKTKNFELVVDGSVFTDDSVMTIAIADALLNTNLSNKEVVDTIIKWANRYPHAGYGSSFRKWAFYDNDHQPYNSCGNGSAMRISAVGWIAKSEQEVKDLSYKVTCITHNHPEGIKGAEVTAMCIYKALHGESKEQIRQYAINNYPEIKEFDYETLRKTYNHGPEICQYTMPQALFCFLISNSFEDCLRTTISIGGDCDTTAAISCAIAEAYYKKIDQDLINKVKSKLTLEMLDIIDKFEEKVK